MTAEQASASALLDRIDAMRASMVQQLVSQGAAPEPTQRWVAEHVRFSVVGSAVQAAHEGRIIGDAPGELRTFAETAYAAAPGLRSATP